MPENSAPGGVSLHLESLHKRFGSRDVVSSIDLAVEPGEFVTLLGPSGSGKTTTLNMIAGIETVTSGRVLVGGQPLQDTPTHQRNIGMVFQNYALFPFMTVAENVAYPLRQRKIPRPEIRRRVAAVLESVHLQDFADRSPRTLSGGQQQRVSVARAIVASPHLLLMDEPLGALDKNLRETLQGEIRRLHRELGATVIFVTHDQEEALSLSDRIAVFNNGRIEQCGTAEELYERPATRFVAEFLGDSNIFPGPVDRAGDQVSVRCGSGEVRGRRRSDTDHSTHLMVRPERCEVVRAADLSVASSDNHVAGTVCDVVYLGADRKVEVEVAGHGRVISRRPAAGALPVSRGDDVQVRWPLEATVCLGDGEPVDAVSEPVRSSAA